MSAFRRWVRRLLRVPPEPQVPAGEPGEVRVFRASIRFYRYNMVRWGLAQAGTLLGLVVGLLVLSAVAREAGDAPAVWALRVLEGVAVLGFLAQLPVTYAMLRLDYDMRWYIVTGRSIRIREGIATVKEKTMTFANIQNMTVRQGPLQRAMGIADLQVRTAGGGGGGEGKAGEGAGESLHEAYFRGVENAEEIREVIRAGVRRHRDAGLGDPDDAAPEVSVAAPGALAAAREVLEEARALRRVAAPG